MSRRRWLLLLLLLIPVLTLAGFTAWASITPAPMPEALAALQTDAQVHVELEPWLVFRPVGQKPTAGLILYPGGRVDPRAYAPAARVISAEGYLTVIVPMPLNLAFFASDRATEVMDAFPEVERWAIGGHSLGGAMAARFAHQHPDVVEGLVLWAAYPANNDDLSDHDLAVVSIYGTRDGLATTEEVDTSRMLLPADARFIVIEGGNHAQFGWYGPQYGDNKATISRPAQQEQIVEATLEFLE